MARGDNLEKVRKHWADIQAWQAEGISQREMAKRLGKSESSLRYALAQVEAAMHAAAPTEVHEGISPPMPALEAQVYQGILLSKTEEARVVLTEMHALLPTLQAIAHNWPSLKTMLQDWSKRQQLLQVSPAYQPYDGFYSCRLNNRLIQAIKEFAARQRLSQSELVTMALQGYMEKHGGEAARSP
jgi:predicted DNA binding CopG/RHH family protein